MTQWVQGKVVAKRDWTEELFSLQIDAPVHPFRAGQFTRLALDINGERVARPYSFVNAPHQRPLEFYFITVPHGPLTERLSNLHSGDSIWVASHPSGYFTLREVPDGDHLWMLATGTALGVFLSLLQTDEPWQRFSKVILVHAVRTRDELTYSDTIRHLQQAYPDQFVMVPFVSREETDFALTGHIPDAIEDGRLEKRTGVPLQPTRSQVMLCGNPGMVRDTSQALEARGFKKNRRTLPGQITTENYW